MGTDMGTPWVTALGAVCIAAVVGAAAWRLAAAGKDRRRAAHLGASGHRSPGVPAKRLAACGTRSDRRALTDTLLEDRASRQWLETKEFERKGI